MRRIASLISTIAIVLAMTLAAAWAHEHHAAESGDHKSCKSLLSDKNFKVIFSGRDQSVQTDLLKYLEVLYGENGLLKQLGFSTPFHVVQFLQNQDLKAIAANNRLPIGHWTDGANILRSQSQPSGILEMVIFGTNSTHSVYRDDLNLKQQISIINHVVGHNHFGVHSRWGGKAEAPNQAAYDFDKYLEELKAKVSASEVSDWIQFLNSLTWAQDVRDAVSETPADFSGGGKNACLKHSSANVLQAFVANLSSDTAEWKKEVARKFEKSVRYIPGAIRTKIMNEGFAVLVQQILPEHTGYTATDDALEYCCLMPGVLRASLDNPYWLGIQAWSNIRRHFNAREEVKKMSAIERDAAFIKYATTEILERMDDSEFLRLGLDEDWIANHNLALTRPLIKDVEEADLSIGPPTDPRLDWQHVVVTRKPERIKEAIIAKVKGFLSFGVPAVRIASLPQQNGESIKLELADEVGRLLPLNQVKMAQTLYVMAKVMNGPVSLESTFERQGKDKSIVKTRIEVTVWPNGRVRADEIFRNNSSRPDDLELDEFMSIKTDRNNFYRVTLPDFTEYLSEVVETATTELILAGASAKATMKTSTLTLPSQIGEQIESSLREAIHGFSPQMRLAVPTLTHATEAYVTEARKRAIIALKLALMGQRKMNRNLAGVKVKAMPDIPYFEYDKDAMKRIMGDLPVPMPALEKHEALSLRFAEMVTLGLAQITKRKPELSGDLPTDINPVKGEPGRKFWGPNPNGGGGRGGEGEGQKGDKAGKGGVDPAFVDIDLKTYAEALGTIVELPNLRPKNGPAETVEEVRGDWTHRRDGTPYTPVIIQKAFARGLADMRLKGDKRDFKKLSAVERLKVLRVGMAKLDLNNDWAVEHFEERPAPEVNAQVTLMMDMSGSYLAFVERTKQMFYDLRAILLTKYKNVTFRFVAFDGTAYAFEDPDEFFRLKLGGGTSYTVGLKSVLKVQEQFPEGQWDRYTVIAGDMEDYAGEGELESTIEAVRQNSQFLASVKMKQGNDNVSTIEKILRQWHDQDPYVSFVDLTPQNDYQPLVLRRLFKNDEKR